MPRYFFTTENGKVTQDHEGETLRNEASAKLEAVKFMGAILKDQPGDFLDHERWRMVVSEKEHGDLFTVEVSMEAGANISDWGDPASRSGPRRSAR